MDKLAINQAIAEACGWVFTDLGNPRVYQCWTNPKGQRRTHIPKYTTDLNAMHEAEKVLTESQRQEYTWELTGTVPDHDPDTLEGDWLTHTATAAQRAEAFLKTLNLWKSSS